MQQRPQAIAAREYTLSTGLESWSTAHSGERGSARIGEVWDLEMILVSKAERTHLAFVAEPFKTPRLWGLI